MVLSIVMMRGFLLSICTGRPNVLSSNTLNTERRVRALTPPAPVNADQMGGNLPVFPVPPLLHDDLATHNAVALLGDGGTEMAQQADEGYYPDSSPIVLFSLAHRASFHARIHGDKRLDRSSGISSFGIFALYYESGQSFEYVA